MCMVNESMSADNQIGMKPGNKGKEQTQGSDCSRSRNSLTYTLIFTDSFLLFFLVSNHAKLIYLASMASIIFKLQTGQWNQPSHVRRNNLFDKC